MARFNRPGSRVVAFVLGTAAVAGVAVVFLMGSGDPVVPAGPADTELALASSESSEVEQLGQALGGALDRVWQQYLVARAGEPRGLEDFRIFLESQGLVGRVGLDQSAALIANMVRSRLPQGLHLEELRVLRRDDDAGTELHFRAILSDARGDRFEAEIVFEVGGEEFTGLDFAMLARNVNCVMCHAQIDNAARVFNKDILATGGFRRVRVGTMSHFKIRPRDAHSMIAGTLYARGRMLDDQGRALNLEESTLSSVAFDEEGQILEDVWGAPVPSGFVKARQAGGNLYADYPRIEAKQVDGILPTHFPSVFPDLNDDRLVQDNEFRLVARATRGQLVGGRKVVVRHGENYGLGGLPTQDLVPELSDRVGGHVVLRGTRVAPLVIDGRIAIDGDLVISGVVKGSGALLVRGDIYLVDSLVYADGLDPDGARTFGVADDGTVNRLGLAAGGSIIVGDPLVNSEVYSKGLVTGTSAGAMNFTMSEFLLFNRLEWTPTAAELPGPNGTVVANPHRNREHRPRYYVLKDGDPVYVMNDARQGRVWFDVDTETWSGMDSIGDWSWGGWTEYKPSDPALRDAVITPLLPGDWLSEASYRGMLNEATASRHGLMVDGLLYTDNALMAAAPRKSLYEGRLRINGAVIAADLGLFAPGDGESPGLTLNYDERLGDLLDIRSERRLSIRRVKGLPPLAQGR